VNRTALLLDLDNILIRGNTIATVTEAQRTLQRIRTACGPTDYTLAVAPRASLTTVLPALLVLGIRWRTCPIGPDSADRDIVEVGQNLIDHGFGHLFIASGDHYFEVLTQRARVTVVLPAGQPVATTLRARADVLAA
jgi:hypothetical protein